ncbi:MAG: ABC transporter permease [Patescibacteria group bacterium]
MSRIFKTYLRLAITALKRQKVRSILTIVGISIGIAAVIVISSAGAGLNSLVVGQLDMFGADTISIEVQVPSTKSTQGAIAMAEGVTITTLKEKDFKTVENYPNIENAYGFLTAQALVSYQGQIKKAMVFGEGYNAPAVETLPIAEGRFYDQNEDNSLSQVVVLGSALKDDLFGDNNAVGETVYIGGKPFKVVGIAGKRGTMSFLDLDTLIYIPVKTVQKRILGIDYYMEIIAKIKDTNKSQQTVEDLTAMIRENHNITDPTKDDFAVQTMAQAKDMIETVLGAITLLLIALVCISLLVGGVGITNIMYVTVAERTFEIGLMKAIGAKSKDILNQFLIEAVIITTAGGIVGVVVGALISLLVYFLAISYGLQWTFSISILSIFLAVGFSALIGLFFGVYPAKKAAGLNPIEALRRE